MQQGGAHVACAERRAHPTATPRYLSHVKMNTVSKRSIKIHRMVTADGNPTCKGITGTGRQHTIHMNVPACLGLPGCLAWCGRGGPWRQAIPAYPIQPVVW